MNPPALEITRGHSNGLHTAAFYGSLELTLALLDSGAFDIDQGSPDGLTPLMVAALNGYSRIVRILLNKGANASIAGKGHITALHLAAQQGNLAVTKLLVKAGANLEAATRECCTPVHLAAMEGHAEVMSVLIGAGANVNCRSDIGSTPLFMAAHAGQVGAVRLLLRAKADPLLTRKGPSAKSALVPLDAAVSKGHLNVVHALIQRLGIEGCGGVTGGGDALKCAAMFQHVGIVRLLTDAGVVDTGTALLAAARWGQVASVKFLLQQKVA